MAIFGRTPAASNQPASTASWSAPAGEFTATTTVPDSIGYAFKRVFLGKPLTTSRLTHERLSNPVALGVLAPDAISSTAYGTEEVLVELLPYAGLAAFTLLLPITGVILVILILVAASYRQVVMAYTRAGGSYVVARENFGPRVAQIAAAALLIDYVVTVAVQTAAGTVAVVSAIPELGPYSLEITVGVVILMCFANLRGLREAGRPFAIPTYFFTFMVVLLIVVGVVREIFGDLPRYHPEQMAGTVTVHHGSGLVMGATVLVLLRAFANGGSSLTGVEAISNTVSSFRKPEGPNARRVLTVMACILGFLLAGVAYLVHETHATPYSDGYPSVLSELAHAVFGHALLGDILYALLQIATALILFTGANTSFNGFPALANFVAEDRFLPRQLTKRGHRLVFSNGIIVLAILGIALLIGTGGSVNALVPFYAIGVFTGFTMAGFGMTKHYLTNRGPAWRAKVAVNLGAGLTSLIVVGIFAVAKFTEGAWLVVIVFPLLVLLLMRLNREYRAEAAILEELRTDRPDQVNYAYNEILVFVNSVDLAVFEALRYGRSLRGDKITAVHFLIDEMKAAQIQRRWEHFDIQVPLLIVNCPDRRVTHAAQEQVVKVLRARSNTSVTVILPRRSYAPLLGRLLHDRTADKISDAISRIPHAAATIIPYDVQSRIRQAFPDLAEERVTRWLEGLRDRVESIDPAARDAARIDDADAGKLAISGLISGHRAVVDGVVMDIKAGSDAREGKGDGPDERVRIVTLRDDTGEMRLKLTERSADTKLSVGQRIEVVGKARQIGHRPVHMVDPAVTILDPADGDTGPATGGPTGSA
jgi:amino acid transporter